MNGTAIRLWEWFFRRGDARPAAALRIAFGAYMLWVLWDLYPSLHLLLGHEGMFGTMNPGLVRADGPFDYLWRHDSVPELEAFFWILVTVAFLATVGLASRFMVVGMILGQMLMEARNPYIAYGTDTVFTHVVFWLCFLDTGHVWSVDRWIAERRGRKRSDEIELWPVKCVQIQVAIVYLFTGLFKLKTQVWTDGSAIYYAIHGRGLDTFLTPYLIEARWLIPPLTYGSLVFELLFPFLVFTSYRYVVLLGGVAFHLGIDLFMMIRFFSTAMFCSYLAFVEPEDWKRILGWIARLRSRVAPAPSGS